MTELNVNDYETVIEQEQEQEEEYDSHTINMIRETIENMSKFNQIEILRILSSHKEVIINENKYGIHINLTELPKFILDELIVYNNYVKTQELELSQAEKQKESYKNIYFIKDNKDIGTTKYTSTTTNSKYAK
jgi:hypothetical protein